MDFDVYVKSYISRQIECDKDGVFIFDLKADKGEHLSPAYFNIDDVNFLNCVDGKKCSFQIEVSWMTKPKRKELFYYVFLTRNNKLQYYELKKDMKKRGIEKRKFIGYCEKYIKHHLREVLDEWMSSPIIGWVNEAGYKQYVVDFRRASILPDRMPRLFNHSYASKERLTEKRNQLVLERLFDWILGDTNLLGIFAYTVHALCYHFCGGEKDKAFQEDVFSICIHGKEMGKVCLIANLLSNLLEYDSDALDSLKTGSYISSSSLKGQPAMFIRIQSLPIIVTHKTNRITRNSSIIHTYHYKRETGELGFFPVYLSRTAINVDEVLDFSVNDISLLEEYGTIKEELNLLLLQFVLYLTEWEQARYKNGTVKDDWNVRYKEEIERLQRKRKYDLGDIKVRSRVLLNIACCIFADYLQCEVSLNDISSQLKSGAKHVFMEADNVIPDKQANAQLTDFALFVKHTLLIDEQERPFLCVEKAEPRTNEECIYLDLKQGYRYYVEYCKQKGVKYFEQDTLKKSLGEENIIKRRSNKGQYDMQRVVCFKGEKYNKPLLVILKAQLILLTGDH